MESEEFTSYLSSIRDRVLGAAGPVLWIALSYADPGKWAASVEGGARFGFDLSLTVLVINCAAMLCHYLCACVAIATGKNLAQIYREEYDDMTCLLLGIQAEISVIMLDLTMVLGTAYGLHVVFGIDLLISAFLTVFDAALFPFFANFLENPRAKTTSIFVACFIFAFYGARVFINQPESSPSAGGMLTKLNGENAYGLMSVLGANIMPHNFYLHSSIVQLDHLPTNVFKDTLCHDHFLATLCIFSGIFLVNCMLMSMAANVYYGSGLVSLTLQDALSLMDQGFKSSLASVALIFVMFFSNQLVAVTWSLGQQVTVRDFFGLEISGWLHRATIKLIAIVPALLCILHSGAEGIFQVLIFTQVVVGLLLPSSIIPLFRVASSRLIMGAYRISHLVEFLALLSFVGVLAIVLVFATELFFGSSDWVINLKWNIESGVPISYIILLIASFASLGSMFWLAITPLKSANSGEATQASRADRRSSMTKMSIDRDPAQIGEQLFEKSIQNQENTPSLHKSFADQQNLSIPTPELNLPETLLDSATNLHLTTIQENKRQISYYNLDAGKLDELESISEHALPESEEIVKNELSDNVTSSARSEETVEKTLKIEGDTQSVNDEGEYWEPNESPKNVPETSMPLISEGPASYMSIKGKNDDLGSGAGSLSRLAGLGRAARRQLAAILDEFWGQLFDFHGQPVPEAKARKLDVLLGVESKIDPKPSSATITLQSTDLSRTSSFYSPPLQHVAQGSIGSALRVQQGSAMWSNQSQMLNAYVRNSSADALDSGERRYRSMHVPSSSIGYDQQPATFHGYNLASYLGRHAKEKGPEYPNFQAPTPSTISNPIDSYALAQPLGMKPKNGMRAMTPPGFHNVPVARNSSMKSERAFHELSPESSMEYSSNPINVKKFYSLPDISGLYVPRRDSSFDNPQWQKNLIGYGQSTSTALGFKEISTPQVCTDAFSLQFGSGSGAGSFYSRQPYEQFGVADKSPPKRQEPASAVDMEAKLLQSFRICVMKLLKLEGSDWLFRQNDGVDEDLIDRVAAREKFLFEVDTKTLDVNLGSSVKIDEMDHSKFMSIPNCGDGCVWRMDLIVSFGVWGIHKILELSLVESRPELWGKYTFVLNRLQGIIELAFSKPRAPISPCFCLQLPVGHPPKSSPPVSNCSLPPPAKPNRGKFTTAAMLLDMTKDVEIAISCRKGRTGTAAGDVAFPKGKENLASVLKRYKRRLSNKHIGSLDAGSKKT